MRQVACVHVSCHMQMRYGIVIFSREELTLVFCMFCSVTSHIQMSQVGCVHTSCHMPMSHDTSLHINVTARGCHTRMLDPLLSHVTYINQSCHMSVRHGTLLHINVTARGCHSRMSNPLSSHVTCINKP